VVGETAGHQRADDAPHPATYTREARAKEDIMVIANFLGVSVISKPPQDKPVSGKFSNNHIELTHLIRWQLIRRFICDYSSVATLLFGSRSALQGSGSGQQGNNAGPLGESPFSDATYVVNSQPESIRRLLGGGNTLCAQTLSLKLSTAGNRMDTTATSNWPNPLGKMGGRKPLAVESMAVFWAAALIYGAIHAAAWNDHFGTQVEALIWKISCVYVAGYGCAVMGLVKAFDRRRIYKESRVMSRMSPRIMPKLVWLKELLPRAVRETVEGFFLVVIPASVLPYLFCRLFLVIEAFISLRSLPAMAFRTPDWTQYLAHL